MTFDLNNLRIGIIGLGYVGLPLAVEFGKRYPTVGFDINTNSRVAPTRRWRPHPRNWRTQSS
jgi:UDP-N-acetyl-D-galactosamine dehydrogenase